MANKRAKTLNKETLDYVLAFAIQRSRVPESDRLKLLLSFRAGLRSCEIARIKVADLTDVEGKPARFVTVFSSVSKGGKSRSIPMHQDIRDALIAFRNRYPTGRYIAISSRKNKGRPRAMTANAITQWFHHLYKDAGLVGCSSHSGRRTFATDVSKVIGRTGASITTLQPLMGHARFETTAAYIDISDDVVALVNAL